jgi:hypothetical protein
MRKTIDRDLIVFYCLICFTIICLIVTIIVSFNIEYSSEDIEQSSIVINNHQTMQNSLQLQQFIMFSK